MRALITGGYGFVGRHLANHLSSCGDDVAVTHLKSETEEGVPPSSIPLPRAAQSVALDVTDTSAVEQVMDLLRPDVIYHLAGISFVPAGEDDERGIFEVNSFGTTNLLRAIKKFSPETRFLFVSSAEVYGEPWPGTLPFTEESVMRPVSTYGVSKAMADLSVFKYSESDNVKAVRVRPFPHIGPGQSERFAISSFAKQLAEIKLGRSIPEIKVGNLESRRDYTDVSDIVRGYREAMLNGKRGHPYNLCSGKSIEVGEVLRMLIEIANVNVEIIEDPERNRQIDITDMYGSYEKAQRDFGWKPRVELTQSLHSLFAHWLETLERT